MISSPTPTSFPLFGILQQDCEKEKTSLTYEEQLELCNKIKDLDDEGNEIVYALLRYYQILIDKDNVDHLPYKPKENKNGLKFDMSVIPMPLVQMIYRFVELHQKKMMEEKVRSATDTTTKTTTTTTTTLSS